MMLLNCTKCDFISTLLLNQTIACTCRETLGRYLSNGQMALIQGSFARLLGMLNSQYHKSMNTSDIICYQWFVVPSTFTNQVIHVQHLHQFVECIQYDLKHGVILNHANRSC